MYTAARGWDIQPSEFWAMCPKEFWLEFDAKIKEQRKLNNASGPTGAALFSQDEWAAARAKVKDL